VTGKDFLDLVRKEGFIEDELVGETGFNSSDMTMGVLLRAKKPEGRGNSKEV